VTVRERDSMTQDRIAIGGVGAYVAERLGRAA
jgi:glycyl-tRNA synthetase (class II)